MVESSERVFHGFSVEGLLLSPLENSLTSSHELHNEKTKNTSPGTYIIKQCIQAKLA